MVAALYSSQAALWEKAFKKTWPGHTWPVIRKSRATKVASQDQESETSGIKAPAWNSSMKPSEDQHDVIVEVQVNEPMEAPDSLGLPIWLHTFWESDVMCRTWKHALDNRSLSDLSVEDLQDLIIVGMPLKYRHKLWSEWLLEPAKFDMVPFEEPAPAQAQHQIELDVCRTHSEFLGTREQRTLQKVLQTYAAHNPAVGYCQGMSSITAIFILLGFEEDTVLRGFSSILAKYCPEYHRQDLAGYFRDIAVLKVLIRRILSSEVQRRLDALEMPLAALATAHFLSLASHGWPPKATVQLWDLLLLKGPPVLFASFLALLEHYLPPVGSGDPLEKVGAFQSGVRSEIDKDLESILKRTVSLLPLIPESLINRLRWVLAGPCSTG